MGNSIICSARDQKYAPKRDQFPNAKEAEDTTITLPITPFMSESDQGRVLDALLMSIRL